MDGAHGNAADWFVDRHLREGRGDRVAFTDPARSLSYADLHAESARFAAGLAAHGVGQERRIALVMQDTVEFPVVFWGALRAGVIPIPVNTLLPPGLTRYILADSRAELVVISAPLLPGLAAILAGLPSLRQIVVVGGADTGIAYQDFLADGAAFAEPVPASAEEVAFWLYSSGSTSNPKGVRHLHASLRATVESYGLQVLGIEPDDVMFSAAKLFFAYGLGNSMTFPMAVGASAILFPHRPTAEAVLAVMRTFKPTLFGGVPTLYAGLLAHAGIGPGAGSPRLRRCISAGEALPEHIGETWARIVGVDILDGIGSTEMLHIFLSNRAGEVRYGTSGVAVPGYELRVVADDGAPAEDGEPGELLVRGDSAGEGYWNQREKTRRTFVGEWTYTGDKYIRQADGCYRYCGRTDDMFKVSGIWVSPFEVEGALITHAAVLEAAVVGHQDGDGLVKPRAFVVLQQGCAVTSDLTRALQTHVKERAGPWKYPRWIEFVDDLPKTATGKIQRFKLREPAWS